MLKEFCDAPIQNGNLKSIWTKVNYHRHLVMQIAKQCYSYVPFIQDPH